MKLSKAYLRGYWQGRWARLERLNDDLENIWGSSKHKFCQKLSRKYLDRSTMFCFFKCFGVVIGLARWIGFIWERRYYK